MNKSSKKPAEAGGKLSLENTVAIPHVPFGSSITQTKDDLTTGVQHS
jgi:hypothetical protein